MGGFHKTLGKIYKPIRTVIDPLNIMDPFRILPGSTAGFSKKGAFSLDPNFGGPLKNLFGGGGGESNYSMPRSSFDTKGMLASQNQMLSNLQAQYGASASKRNQMLDGMKSQFQSELSKIQSSNDQLRSSKPLFPTNSLQETVTSIDQATPAINAPTTVAQSKIDGTTNIASDLPVEFVYKPANSTAKNVTANSFTLPDMSNIKFGGV